MLNEDNRSDGRGRSLIHVTSCNAESEGKVTTPGTTPDAVGKDYPGVSSPRGDEGHVPELRGPGPRLRGRGQRRGWASCKRGTGELREGVVPGAGPLAGGGFDTEDAVAVRSTLSYLITVPQWGLGLRVRAAQALCHQRRQQCSQGRPRAGRGGEASEEQRRSMPGQEARCPHPPPRNFIAAWLSAAA